MIHKLNYTVLFSLALFTFMGCEAEEFSIQILGVKPVDTSTCGPDSNEQSFMANGLVDIAISGDYHIYLSMTNRLLDSLEVNNLSAKDGRINTTDITISGATITYLDPDEVGFGFSEDRRKISFSGLLKANGVGILNQGMSILTPEMMTILRDHGTFKGVNTDGRPTPIRSVIPLNIEVQVEGKTLDGKEVLSNIVNFPITICTGCRISANETDTECEIMSEDEIELVSKCPASIGRDNGYASCALCDQIVAPQFASLCEL
jgi:hypothetical protein